MTDEKWVSVKDEMPGIGKKVQVTFSSGRYEELNFKIDDVGGLGFFDQNGTNYFSYKISHWRYPVEKHPDFGKLKKGDILIIHSPQNGIAKDRIITGALAFQDEDIMMLSHSRSSQENYSSSAYTKRDMKKITRINLEEKTFEEI